jgi:hypothetical protein
LVELLSLLLSLSLLWPLALLAFGGGLTEPWGLLGAFTATMTVLIA